MAEKTLNARVITKNDTKANWDKATNFVPKKGELIVYTDERKIKIGDGSTKVPSLPYMSLGEAYLTWGGKNFDSSYGPIDAALVPELGANRFAYLPPADILVEYSRDGGVTWIDYEATDAQKTGLTIGGAANWIIGKNDTAGAATPDYKLRVIFKAGHCYTALNKFILYVSTAGSTSCKVTIDARLQSNVEAGVDTWTVFASNASIGGWSGYNVVNTSGLTFYGNASAKTSQYGEIRFTFSHASCGASYKGLQVINIFAYGGVGWSTPSTLAKRGSMYSIDTSKNCTFPAKVTASSLAVTNGTASGFLKANGTIDTNSYATTADATTSAHGLMTATDKTKLNGIATGATKVEASTTNGKVKINGTDTTVYTLPTEVVTITDATVEHIPYYGADLSLCDSGVGYKDLRNPEYFAGTGTAAVTSSPYCFAKWNLTGSDLTELKDGATLIYKVPVAGNASYGTCLSIDGGTTYHPVVTQTNTHIGTRYGVGTMILLVYDSVQTLSVYGSSAGVGSKTAAALTGCWRVVNDYDSGNSGDYYQRDHGTYFTPGNVTYRYQWKLTDGETIYSVNTTNNTTGTKTGFFTGEFDPLAKIYYYASTTTVEAGSSKVNMSSLYWQYLADLRYSFNGITNNASGVLYGKTGKMLYLVASLQPNGKAKLYYGASGTDYLACLTTTLPTTEDGLLYIKLGLIYDYYRVQLTQYPQPVLWFKDGEIRPYVGKADTNQTIKVGSTTFGTNDAVELVAGDNVTLTPNTTNKTITISTESSSGDTYLYSYLNVDQNKPCYNTGTTWHWGYYVSGAEIPFTPDTFKPIMLKKIKYNNVVYANGTCRGVAIESKTNHNKAVRFDILINSVWRTVGLAIFTNNPNPSTSHTRYEYLVLMSYNTEWDLIDCNEVGIVLIDISLDGDIQLSGNTEIYLEIPEEPVVDVITFSISGVNYSATNGMTWGEWLISKYNTSSIAFKWPTTTTAAITTSVGDYLYSTSYEEQTLATLIESGELYLIE